MIKILSLFSKYLLCYLNRKAGKDFTTPLLKLKSVFFSADLLTGAKVCDATGAGKEYNSLDTKKIIALLRLKLPCQATT